MKRFLPLILIAIVGCGASESTVVGSYSGEALDQKGAGNLANNVIRGFASSMSLDIKPDKTFHLVMTVLPVDGKWTLTGDTLTLTPDKVMGFDKSDAPAAANQPMTFRVNGDVLEPVGSGPASAFKFVRKKGDAQLP